MDYTEQQIHQKVYNQELSVERALELLHDIKTKYNSAISDTNWQNRQVNSHIKTKNESFDQQLELSQRLQLVLLDMVASLVHLPVFEIEPAQNLMELGIDSLQLMQISTALEEKLQLELYPTLLIEYPNIEKLSEYLLLNFRVEISKAIDSEPVNAVVNSSLQSDLKTKLDAPPKSPVEQSIEGTSEPTDENRQVFEFQRDKQTVEDIAIIGMGGVFAESGNIDEFWENVRTQKNLIKVIPEKRFDYKSLLNDRNQSDDLYCIWGGFIDEVEMFDHEFFRMAPREAEMVDPQLRHLLQVMQTTAEDAGYGARIKGSNTGVYIGACFHDYLDLISKQELITPFSSTGNAMAMMANRPSFFFDLKGPSLAIDTACSSTLVTVHMACQALQKGECELAFVAGVNLILNIDHYIHFCSINALSRSGRCHTFDKRADGYVPSESVAAVLLKPLEKAVADKDRIYAVIKGSAVNHGGYTPSVTAPNVNQETNVILKAWENAAVDPETIGYIEAHGTGTSLGDPIEIDAIKAAFNKFTSKKSFCCVGSVKAHLGHTESSAGIVGLIKSVLSVTRGEIPVMPTFKEMNPYINLQNSSLKINRNNQKWEGINGAPRRAGINSFGFGGTYAHVVVEDYPAGRSQKQIPLADNNSSGECLFVLSAKKIERLKAYAKNLASFLASFNGSLQDLAYTLQIGREAMNYRIAIISNKKDELAQMLLEYATLPNNAEIDRFYQGDTKKNRSEKQMVFHVKQEPHEFKLTNDQLNLQVMAEKWVAGESIEWSELYPNNNPSIISAPTYPFAKNFHWIKLPESDRQSQDFDKSSALHPLVHENVSDFDTQRFTSIFKGNEFFLKDHVINGKKILPGAAYLEIAYLAAALSDKSRVRAISRITWAKPIISEESPVKIEIALYPKDENKAAFEIFQLADQSIRQTHAMGKIEFGEPENEADDSEMKKLDIASIKARSSKHIEKVACYQYFKENGIQYGPAFQIIQEMHHNRKEALAFLNIPGELLNDFSKYKFHPSLLDGSFQAVLGILLGITPQLKSPYIPYSLAKLEIFDSLPTRCYAYASLCGSSDDQVGPEINVDISLANTEGLILANINNLVLRKSEIKESKVQQLLFCEKVWSAAAIPNEKRTISGTTVIIGDNDLFSESVRLKRKEFGETVLYVKPGNTFKEHAKDTIEINPHAPADYIKLMDWLKGDNNFPANIIIVQKEVEGEQIDIQDCLLPFVALTKAIIKAKFKEKIVCLYIYPYESADQLPDSNGYSFFAAMSGYFDSVKKEHPLIDFRILEVLETESPRLVELALEELRCVDSFVARYENSHRLVRKTREIRLPELLKDSALPQKLTLLKESGVYLITGGFGGLGLLLANYISESIGSKIILCGRTKLDDKGQSLLIKLNLKNSELIYRQVDITQETQLKDLISEIKSRFGKLDGIFHCAGVIKDAQIADQNLEDINSICDPKIKGAIYLDLYTRHEHLDFFVLFSSISGFLGNAGQACYAYANTFLDHFASLREAEKKKGKRHGKTLSINWPYWKSGGMKLNERDQELIYGATGIASLESETGLKVLTNALSLELNNFAVLCGDTAKIKSQLKLGADESTLTRAKPRDLELDSHELRNLLERRVVEIASQLLKVEQKDIDPKEDMKEYGFESIILSEFAEAVSKSYLINLSPAVFFELEEQTISSFVDYLVKEHPEQIIAKLGTLHKSVSKTLPTDKTLSFNEGLLNIDRGSRFRKKQDNISYNKEPVAIIGINCVMPKSDDYETFWKNLEQSKDLISEMPRDRWDWRQFAADLGNLKWGGFMNEVDKFDPLFFGISPSEAENMDPQHRIFLETVWKTIEDAGYKASDMSGSKTSVFVGVANSDYADIVKENSLFMKAHATTGLAHSILANRISYFFNLHGPSEPINTACSSSLVAVHRGIESIRYGECEMAIVGGVNVLLSPTPFIAFNEAGMLSKAGRCRAFDERADGYVRGEGAGAVLLKPLSQAIKAGDHIYAVIKGSAINHGGRAKSLTAPNTNAQVDVLQSAYRDAEIPLATVSYIEAHGTGTVIGDQVEINGLKKVFGNSTKPYCGIGSVKSNMGLLETASGIASLIKVVLSMKYAKLPPTIHLETVNPHIHLEDTPFYFVKKTQSWDRLKDADHQEIPRRAGVNSFGFGGVNCHLVLEEYQDKVSPPAKDNQNHQIIVLSAKNENRLKAYAKIMAGFIATSDDLTLVDFAYTLQIGRESMDERLALVVSDIQEAQRGLKAFSEGKPDVDGLFCGNVKENQSKNDILVDGAEGEYFIKSIVRNGKLSKIAKLWVSGVSIDWNLLPGEDCRKRLALPTYPFQRLRNWISQVDKSSTVANFSNHIKPKIHPLVGRNVSTLTKLQFTTQFSGSEFFLSHHLVDGQQILPGVAFLEMARAAAEIVEEAAVAKLLNIVWIKSVIINGDSDELLITLQRDEKALNFIISTKGMNGREHIHSKGSLFYANSAQIPNKSLTRHFDITAINNRCDQSKESAEIYNLFQKKGLSYGPAFQVIQSLCFNSIEALSYIVLPECVKSDYNDFALHPSLMDGALQTVIGLLGQEDATEQRTYLPFSLGEVDIIDFPQKACFVHVIHSDAQPAPSSSFKQFDIGILDSDGRLLVSMKNFILRPFELKNYDGDGKWIAQSTEELPGQENLAEFATDKQKDHQSPSDSNNTLIAKVADEVRELIAKLLKIDQQELDFDEDLSDFGMDSMMMIAMLRELEEKYGGVVEPSALTDYPTILSIAEFLVREKVINTAITTIEPNKQPKLPKSANKKTADPIELFENTQLVDNAQTRAKIAVISLACRFPKSPNLESFWQNLIDGESLISEVPNDRWPIDEFYSPNREDSTKTYSKWGGFIEGIDWFDARFFGISDTDARLMDPQHRLLLELTQELIDRAGYKSIDIDSTKTAVLIGGGTNPYIHKIQGTGEIEFGKRQIVNSIENMMAARISDYYNLKGVSQTIDTACSSSLVAIHQACQGISSGEFEMAIAGGIELLLDETLHIGFSNAEVLSDEDKTYVFDEKAKGFVLGEGAGLCLLKSYEAAIKDGDQIMAVVSGSAVNNDGRTMGLTVPNKEAQIDVIKQALANANVQPQNITYLETHGTGTLLGDPIEIRAATKVYEKYTQEIGYCAVGSVKTNIGHLMRAAGIASFIKTVLAIQNKRIPATLNCDTPHPRFKFDNSPFLIARKTKKWEPLNFKRYAAVSSFGFGGTNCHLILEEQLEDHTWTPSRKALSPTIFNRKCFNVTMRNTFKHTYINDQIDEDFHEELLEKLKQGLLTVEQSMQLVKEEI